MIQTEISSGHNNSKPARTVSISPVPEWITETINVRGVGYRFCPGGANGGCVAGETVRACQMDRNQLQQGENKLPIMNQTETPTRDNNSKTGSISTVPEWITETINGGSFPVVDLNTGSNGWASPPNNVFSLRSVDYFKNQQKSPAGDSLLSLAGVDFLKSTVKLDNVLSRPDNRVAHARRKAQSRGESLNSFIFAVNYQTPSKEPYSLVIYFATEDPIPTDTLLYRLINEEEDSFRNERFKSVGNVVKGPRVVKVVAGKYSALLLGKNVTCNYYRGSNYFEIDVDIGSSTILSTALCSVLGYASSVTLDVGFVVEAQKEDELPEKLIGAVRVCHIDLSSAFFVVDDDQKTMQPCRMMGSAKANGP